MDRKRHEKAATPAPGVAFGLGPRNAALLAAGAGAVTAGYAALGRGSVTLGPLLLVAGYFGLIPAGLLAGWRPGRAGRRTDTASTGPAGE